MTTTDHLEFEVIPATPWVEGDERGLSWPELHCTGRHNGKPVRLRIALGSTSPSTVELGKQKVREHLDKTPPMPALHGENGPDSRDAT